MLATYQHGIYPRSEVLVTATRDLDRGRTTPEAMNARFDQDLREFVQVQTEAELDYFSDGMLRWQDLFRPLIEACPGLDPGALTRWFDNNAFFRAPQAGGDVGSFDGTLPAVFDTAASVPEPRLATLPSPFLFSRVSVWKGNRNDLMLELARNLIRPLAERLVVEGYGLIQLQEPWLVFHGIDDGDWKPFEESVRLVTDGLGATTVLHTYFGDASPHADRLRELPVDAIGFDFGETDVDALGSRWEKAILVGCIDGRRSLIEPVGDVVAFVQQIAERLQPPAIYVSSVSDLEVLPHALARQKVLLLGEVGRRLKELLT